MGRVLRPKADVELPRSPTDPSGPSEWGGPGGDLNASEDGITWGQAAPFSQDQHCGTGRRTASLHCGTPVPGGHTWLVIVSLELVILSRDAKMGAISKPWFTSKALRLGGFTKG